MHNIYFARHGETVWNVENKICGMTDSPLTEKGRQQARELGRKVRESGVRIDEILYSPLSRAADTPTTPGDGDKTQKFPAFEGKDLNGNPVKSDDLFSKNAVTVVNFWFTTCNPCVGELSELESLHQELTKKGGGVIGINSFTLGGDEAAISEAKSVLSKKGVTYPNVYFPAQGEAGKFVENVFAYPTTYVVDRNGNIVGDPIVGAITEKKQAETLQKLIDQTLAADMG